MKRPVTTALTIVAGLAWHAARDAMIGVAVIGVAYLAYRHVIGL